MSTAKELKQFMELTKSRQITIGGMVYKFGDMTFREARKVFAYLSVVGSDLESGNVGFIDTDKFISEIEPLLIKYTSVDDFKLTTLENHFDENPNHYIQFVSVGIQVYASPFMPASDTNSTSTQQESRVTTLRKPM